VQNVQQVGDKL